MRLGWGLGVGSAFGMVTVSTPLSRLALTSSSLMLSGRAKERQKETDVRSLLTTCKNGHGTGGGKLQSVRSDEEFTLELLNFKRFGA